jgi:tetratricopeptide (TPR) repeat protein
LSDSNDNQSYYKITMELALIGLLVIPYMLFRYYKHRQFTPFERDIKSYSEGINLFYEQKYYKSYAYFDKKTIQNPKSAAAYYYRGKCNMKLENVHSALYDFSIALTFDNTVPEIYIEKGKIHLSRHEPARAFRELNKAVWHSHNLNAEALRLRAVAHIQLGQLLEAHEDLQEALQLGDEHAHYLLKSYPFPNLRSRNNPF